jgi:hypothetical protein
MLTCSTTVSDVLLKKHVTKSSESYLPELQFHLASKKQIIFTPSKCGTFLQAEVTAPLTVARTNSLTQAYIGL